MTPKLLLSVSPNQTKYITKTQTLLWTLQIHSLLIVIQRSCLAFPSPQVFWFYSSKKLYFLNFCFLTLCLYILTTIFCSSIRKSCLILSQTHSVWNHCRPGCAFSIFKICMPDLSKAMLHFWRMKHDFWEQQSYKQNQENVNKPRRGLGREKGIQGWSWEVADGLELCQCIWSQLGRKQQHSDCSCRAVFII